MSNKVKIKWTEVKQKASEEIKRIMARNILLAYASFSKGFKIHIDDSYFQL